MATTNFQLKPFVINLDDLNFLMRQIKFKPLFDNLGNAIVNWDGIGSIYDGAGLLIWDAMLMPMTPGAAIAAFGTSYASTTASQGLRDVTGMNNNLNLVNATWGAVDQPFLQTVAPNFAGYLKPLLAGDATAFYAANTFGVPITGRTNYEKSAANPADTPATGNIVDYTPRMISRIVTTAETHALLDANGQPAHWYASQYTVGTPYWNLFNAKTVADGRVASSLLTLTSAESTLSAATLARQAATAAALTASNAEAVALTARDVAAQVLLEAQGAQGLAQQNLDTATLAYTTQFALTVEPVRILEEQALAARDLLLVNSPEWVIANDAYLAAAALTQAAILAIAPLLTATQAALAAFDLAFMATEAAVLPASDAQAIFVSAEQASGLAALALTVALDAFNTANASEIAAQTAYDASVLTAATAVNVSTVGLIEGAAVITDYGLLAALGQRDAQNPGSSEYFIGATNPGVAPGNTWLAYFGQFFDHGLDFIGKGAAGTKITIPLAADDPLYRAPGTNGPTDPGNTRITVSRADVSGFDAAGNAQWVNHTSPYIDQSQTYGSNDQMTSLLREWVADPVTGGFRAGSTLIDGSTVKEWKNGFGEITRATLPTLAELRAHLLATGRDDLSWADVSDLRARDAKGDVIDNDPLTAGIQASGTGQALLLDMNPHFDVLRFDAALQARLAAAGFMPGADGSYALYGPGSLGGLINFRTFAPTSLDPDLAFEVLMQSVGDHYIAGDGRVNENIGLTTIHHVFHEEHNYQVRNIQNSILAQDATAAGFGGAGYDHNIARAWQVAVADGAGGFHTDAAGNYLLSAGGGISWNNDKVFEATKLVVEMEYQHTAVDQYARTITPDIPEFVGYNSGANATIAMEFAQGAFRFGHSTMRESIDTMDPNGSITGKVMSIALEKAFLNPALFAEKGAASIAMGMVRQQMSEVDEFLTPAMNQGLLGMPLDLAAINIARGRDLGLPTLNEFREGVGLLRYISWADFGNNMIHRESLVNFIAAYSFDGNVAKARAIIGLESGSISEGDAAAMGYTLGYAINFLNGADMGYNKIDTWIGGLAEAHVMGGLLGETFNVVFVDQISRLMDGDRFYYLYRLNNMQFGDEIGNAQFKDLIERNTGAEHLNGSAFAYADQYVDLTETAALDAKTEHKYGGLGGALALNPTLGVWTGGGNSTASNGSIITINTVNGVQSYIRDIRVEGANGNPNIAASGLALDGTPQTGANSSEVLVATDNNDFIMMGGGDDTAYGEGGNDIISGGAGIDRLYGGDGADVIYGGDGGDLIDGGAGDDVLYGESSGSAAAGVDQLIGGAGNDILYGGVGIDKLFGSSGDDAIFGGSDTDPFTHGGDGNDYIDGGTGGDNLYGDDGDDLVVGGNDQDIVAGGDGDDILRPGNPSQALGGGPDEVLGGDGATDQGSGGFGTGFDLIDFSDYVANPKGVVADLVTQQNPLIAIDGTTPFPAWVGIEGIIGSRNNDTQTGDVLGNWLIGGSGNDSLTGGGGNDVIVGDGIRLDSLIGTYGTGYTSYVDGASNRATGPIGNNGLLGNAALGTEGFDKHLTEMLRSAMYKDLVLGGATKTTLAGGGSIGDGGVAGASDVAVFTGSSDEYQVSRFEFVNPQGITLTAIKVVDTVAGRDGTDLLVGVESARFSNGLANLLNAAPVAVADTLAAVEDTAITYSAAQLLGNDLDANGQPLRIQSVAAIHGGAVTLNADGSVTFVPGANFNGAASFSYTVSDGQLVFRVSAPGLVTVNVAAVNDAPTVASALAALTTAEDAPFGFTVPPGTFVDVDLGDTLVYTAALANGNALPAWLVFDPATRSFSGTPANGDVGVSSVRVTATDSGNASASSIFALTVTNTNDAPMLTGVKATLASGIEDVPYTASLAALLAGFTDIDPTGDVLNVANLGALNGIVTLGAGQFTFTPTANYNGPVTLNYNVVDGNGGITAATQSFALAAVNDPTQGSVTLSPSGLEPLATVSITQNLSDPDGAIGPISYQWQSAPGGSTTWTDIAGATGTSYTPPVGGVQLRAVASYSVGGAATETMTSSIALVVQLAQLNPINGTNGANTIIGTALGDLISGLGGNDVIFGMGGNDRIVGGAGRDMMTGGAGADTFVFSFLTDSQTGAGRRDIITDFTIGVDKLDFSALDANVRAGATGDQAFSLIGTAAFGNVAGQLRYTMAGGVTLVEGDVNGDALADFQVQLNGNRALTSADIFL